MSFFICIGVFLDSTFYFKRFLTFDFSKKRLLTGLSKDAAAGRRLCICICVWLPGWFIGHGVCSMYHGLASIPLDVFLFSNFKYLQEVFCLFHLFQTDEETVSQIIMKLCN